jgi:predicted RNA methylase
MVNDVARASAFKGGLADVIQPSSIVVDLGSGSGLLSVMAAKLGARHVFAIEQDSSLAEASRRVMIENGVSHVVSVINRLQ